MPKNRIMYYGVLVIVASALIWIGAELTKRIEWILPYTFTVGIVLVLIGAILEVRNKIQRGPVEKSS